MAGSSRFSEDLLKLVEQQNHSGEAMIAVSRAILRNDYSEAEFDNDLFSIFVLIDDETGHIILDGFAEFNFPSGRHSLSESLVVNTFKALASFRQVERSLSNSKIHRDEIDIIANSYGDGYSSSLREFKDYFGI
jgi:hypothetical protein